MPEPPPAPRRRRWGRWLLAAAALLVALTAAAYLLLPLVARPLLERALSAALDTPVTIGALAWEPAAGRVSARAVALGAAGERIAIAHLFVEGSPRALWRGEIAIDRITITAPTGALQLDAHYRPMLPGFGSEGGAAPRLPPIAIRELLVTDGVLTVRYPVQQELRAAEVRIARLTASDASAVGDALAMRAQLTGSLDGAPLALDAELRRDGGATGIEATGSVTGLAVNRRVIDLLPALDTFNATVDVRGTYTSATAPARHALRLDITLHEPRITDDAGTEFAAATVALPDVRIDLADGAIAIDRVEINAPAGAVQLDAQYRPTLASFGSSSGAAAAGAQPTLTIGELVITDGALSVRYPVQGVLRAAPLQLARLVATNVTVAGGRLALQAQLSGTLDGAPLTADARLRGGGADASIEVDITLSKFPLRRDRLTLPAGLETLRATLDVEARYAAHDAPPRQTVQLDARLAEARLDGPDGTAFSARALVLPAMRVDLLARQIDLGPVTLTAPVADVVITADGLVFPRPAAGDGAATAAGDAAAQPFAVRPGAIDLSNGRLRVRRGTAHLDLLVASASWDGYAPGRAQPVALRASTAAGATVSVSGALGLEPLAGALEVRAQALPLPELAALSDLLPLALSRGTGDAALRVSADDGRLRAQGTLRVDDLHTVPPDPARPVEVMAVSRADAELVYDSAATPPLDVAALTLSYPYVMVQRRAAGTFPYSLLVGDADGERPRADATAATAHVRLRAVQIEGGKVEFLDATLEPVFWSSLSHISGEASDVVLPQATQGRIALTARVDELSPVEISATLTPAGVEGRVALRDALLPSLNAYVSPLLGYDVTAGWLSLDIRAAPRPPLYHATAAMVLRDVDVLQTGDDLIQSQSGVPLPIALSLIADSAGRIDMTLPIAVDPDSGRVTLGSVVGQAIRNAIVAALTSPLRILGSLFGTRGAPHAFAIDPIPFPAGDAELDAAGAVRVAEIARILQAHPGLVLVATPQITAADRAAVGDADSDARALADERLAAVRAAFTGDDGGPALPAERLMLVGWKPSPGAPPSDLSGVYVELQDRP